MLDNELDIKLHIAKVVGDAAAEALRDNDRAIAELKHAASTRLKEHLWLVPADATVHNVDSSLAKKFVEAWAAQYLRGVPEIWFPLSTYINELLDASKWTIVPERISNPDPHKMDEIYNYVHITVRRIVTH